MTPIADTWESLCCNAEKFHLNPEKFNRLSGFFTRLDKNVFRKLASQAVKKFPMEKVKQFFSGKELEQFLLLCVVANYDYAIEKYRKEGWPDGMRNEILDDLQTWASTLEADLGGYGLIPRIFFWSCSCLNGEVKSFGRLQGNSMHSFYAPFSLRRKNNGDLLISSVDESSVQPELAFGDQVINIHIPATGPLVRKECIQSLKRMCDFSAKYQPDYKYKAIICYSWLLDPQFQNLLIPESHIVQFQKLGHVFPWKGHNQDAEVRWRLWGNKGNDLPLKQLEADNSLKRAVVTTLQSGGHFTEGILVIFRDELPQLWTEL